MGMVKAWLMEQAEKERDQEILDWWNESYGENRKKVTGRMIEEYEQYEWFSHAMSKDD